LNQHSKGANRTPLIIASMNGHVEVVRLLHVLLVLINNNFFFIFNLFLTILFYYLKKTKIFFDSAPAISNAQIEKPKKKRGARIRTIKITKIFPSLKT